MERTYKVFSITSGRLDLFSARTQQLIKDVIKNGPWPTSDISHFVMEIVENENTAYKVVDYGLKGKEEIYLTIKCIDIKIPEDEDIPVYLFFKMKPGYEKEELESDIRTIEEGLY